MKERARILLGRGIKNTVVIATDSAWCAFDLSSDGLGSDTAFDIGIEEPTQAGLYLWTGTIGSFASGAYDSPEVDTIYTTESLVAVQPGQLLELIAMLPPPDPNEPE